MILNDKVVLALSRHEFDGVENIYKDQQLDKISHANTQDAWLFRTPLITKNCDFHIGAIGCDNALADRLYKSNILPVNYCSRFKIIHYDLCRKKTTNNFIEIHEKHDKKNVHTKPELDGYRFLPDFDKFQKIEDICNFFGMNAHERYDVICNIFNSKMRLNNKYSV